MLKLRRMSHIAFPRDFLHDKRYKHSREANLQLSSAKFQHFKPGINTSVFALSNIGNISLYATKYLLPNVKKPMQIDFEC